MRKGAGTRMKKRHERRRRTRRAKVQRGGAIDSVQDWIESVKNSEMFKKDTDRSKTGAYHFSDLKDDSLRFQKKEPTQELVMVEPAYDINNQSGIVSDPLDIRVEGANLALKWAPLTAGNPTPAEFKGYIEQHLTPGDAEGDPDLRLASEYLITVENKLRSDKIDSLTDESKYPLFVWSLIMNAEGEEAPTLVPPMQVNEELAVSQSEPEPSQVQPSQVQPSQVQPEPTVQPSQPQVQPAPEAPTF